MHSDVLAQFPAATRDGAGWAARCPAHDDHRASLSIGTGDDGRTLLHCHAGCSLDAILDAVNLDARDLFPAKTIATTRTIVATYAYHDEGGAHLFDVVRFAPKDFRQRRADGTWKMNGVRRVLYRLPELQGQTIAYLVEGEKDADRLRAIGLPGTANAGGAGKWRTEYVEQLKAASVEHVVVVPDNDEPGRQHAEAIARSCHAAGIKVKVVTLPGLPVKGDVSDYLEAGHTKAQLVALVKATPLYAPAAATTPAVEPADAAPRKSQATRLVDLALAAGVELWHSPAGDAYVTLPADGHREHHRLNTSAVHDWLARRHHAETRGAPGGQAVADALAVLSGMARYDGAEHATAVRVGGGREVVYLDLGDPSWRAVEITPAGWRVVADPPVRLIRSRGMLALPEPVRGGSIDVLRSLVHVASGDDYRLLVGWVLGALRPAGPYPLLSLVGEQGSGKSTMARLVRRTIDPHVAELRAEPRTIDDIMIAATRSRVVALDNLSHLAPWLSDALCRVSTGGALTKRELYSNDDEIIIEAVRPTIVTSIADIVTRGDLLDRAIAVTLPVLPEGDRLPEAELWRRYDAAAPGILGALLDAVVAALSRERTIAIDALPRMADWAVWVTAAEPALGWPEQSILSAYRVMRGAAISAALDGDLLAGALRGLTLPWGGTAAELLAKITPAVRAPRGWPESPRAMSAALRRLAPGLRRIGIGVSTYKEAGTGGRRLIAMTTSEDGPDRPSPSSPSSQPPSLLEQLCDAKGDANGAGHAVASQDEADKHRVCDVGDGCDDGSPLSSGRADDEELWRLP